MPLPFTGPVGAPGGYTARAGYGTQACLRVTPWRAGCAPTNLDQVVTNRYRLVTGIHHAVDETPLFLTKKHVVPLPLDYHRGHGWREMAKLFNRQDRVDMIMVIAFMGPWIPVLIGALSLATSSSSYSEIKTKVAKEL